MFPAFVNKAFKIFRQQGVVFKIKLFDKYVSMESRTSTRNIFLGMDLSPQKLPVTDCDANKIDCHNSFHKIQQPFCFLQLSLHICTGSDKLVPEFREIVLQAIFDI